MVRKGITSLLFLPYAHAMELWMGVCLWFFWAAVYGRDLRHDSIEAPPNNAQSKDVPLGSHFSYAVVTTTTRL